MAAVLKPILNEYKSLLIESAFTKSLFTQRAQTLFIPIQGSHIQLNGSQERKSTFVSWALAPIADVLLIVPNAIDVVVHGVNTFATLLDALERWSAVQSTTTSLIDTGENSTKEKLTEALGHALLAANSFLNIFNVVFSVASWVTRPIVSLIAAVVDCISPPTTHHHDHNEGYNPLPTPGFR